MDRFNALSSGEAERRLYSCFADHAWARSLASGRPYEDLNALLAAADSAWTALEPQDWRTAFAAHPRIGERGGDSPEASEREQRGVMKASEETRAGLAAENRLYEDRFGHVFLIAASGRSADEIRDALVTRMANDPETELEVAAGEHRKITRMRLEEVVSS